MGDQHPVLEIGDVLAEIPDVPVRILGKPVEGVLDHLAIDRDGVPHHHGSHTHHDPGFLGHHHFDPLHLTIGLALEDPSRTNLQGQIRVVDHLDEPARVDHGGVLTAVTRVYHRSAPTTSHNQQTQRHHPPVPGHLDLLSTGNSVAQES